MSFDDFDFDDTLLDDTEFKVDQPAESSEDRIKLQLLKQLLHSPQSHIQDDFEELESLLYGKYLALLGGYDALNIEYHYKIIKNVLAELKTAQCLPIFHALSDDILAIEHGDSTSTIMSFLRQWGLSNNFDSNQCNVISELSTRLVCHIGGTQSWQVHIVNNEGYTTDLTTIDSEVLLSLFDDKRDTENNLARLFSLHIGIPNWKYESTVLTLRPQASNRMSQLTINSLDERLNQFTTILSESIPYHPKSLINCSIDRVQRYLDDIEQHNADEVTHYNEQLLNNEALSDIESKDINEYVKSIKKQIVSLQNAKSELKLLTKKITDNIEQLATYLNIRQVDDDLPRILVWYSVVTQNRNAKVLLESFSNSLIENPYCLEFDVLKDIARSGLATAQYALGLHYYYGNIIDKNMSEAITWFYRAAEKDHCKAQVDLGFCYEFGFGVKKNKEKAVYWYKKSASQNFAEGCYRLGLCYEKGQGLKQSISRAVENYKKAVDQNFAEGEYALANCYYDGNGFEMNKKKAFELYSRAAQHGVIEAQLILGDLYKYGIGTGKDEAESNKWYRKAVAQEGSSGLNAKGDSYKFGRGVNTDKEKAADYYQMSAKEGDAEGQTKLGLCYEYGEGVEVNKSTALGWYFKAAKQGYAIAQFYLGECYFYGKGNRKDSGEGIKWFLKAAEQGYADAEFALGICYETGDGVFRDFNKALEWFEKAASKNHVKAQYKVTKYHQEGPG